MTAERVDRYRLLRKLAHGGMGEIFLAESLGAAGFRRHVVVKRLFEHLHAHEETVRMFQNEAHVLSHLHHPNIPQVYDLGRDAAGWFLVIEHVPGHTLGQILQRVMTTTGDSIPLDVTLAAMIQLCEALHHAHECLDEQGVPLRIVHRDVTPHNVMVTPDGFAKLLDFGVARQGLDHEHGGALQGTLSYMAPEQVRSQRLDKRSDVFSVGVMLYELTTGTRLFTGPDVDVMQAIVERDVAPPTSFIPGYPPDLEQLVLTALARDRTRRWPSAAHLERALEEFAGRRGMLATHRVLARFYQATFLGRAPRPVPARPAREASVSRVIPQALLAHDGSDLHAMSEDSGTLSELEALGGAPPVDPGVEGDPAPAPLALPDPGAPMALGVPKRRGRGVG